MNNGFDRPEDLQRMQQEAIRRVQEMQARARSSLEKSQPAPEPAQQQGRRPLAGNNRPHLNEERRAGNSRPPGAAARPARRTPRGAASAGRGGACSAQKGRYHRYFRRPAFRQRTHAHFAADSSAGGRKGRHRPHSGADVPDYLTGKALPGLFHRRRSVPQGRPCAPFPPQELRRPRNERRRSPLLCFCAACGRPLLRLCRADGGDVFLAGFGVGLQFIFHVLDRRGLARRADAVIVCRGDIPHLQEKGVAGAARLADIGAKLLSVL